MGTGYDAGLLMIRIRTNILFSREAGEEGAPFRRNGVDEGLRFPHLSHRCATGPFPLPRCGRGR